MASIQVAGQKRMPGEEGVWGLIIGDLFVFSLFFLTTLYYRASEAEVFARSQLTLNLGFGLINTLLLLTSSLLVATGVHRVRSGRPLPSRFFGAAILCGLGFVAIKVVEYSEKIRAGLSFGTNDFYMLYFAFTGIHLFHVLIGLGVLTYLMKASRRPEAAMSNLMLIESGACFWHLVDLLWIVLFALFYLVR
jgi:nitric oxide reductase NorE protein